MTGRYLEVTFRKGKPFAAYLYLPRREGEKSVRTQEAGNGLLVDYAADGSPMGLEILNPGRVSFQDINKVLREIGLEPVAKEELAPVVGAA